ncbi:adenosine-specific kinase [Sphaerobacter sp.]|uniref:adenosine-specific kinase n=1 Tax=Sphaerobacter sp. TaxID=2099654 RepID=UPI001D825403|nr:adenosine-specific kinase [Sphaerobacter sp.]MBX5445835.1 adenosine-specific kinase [Sphaerobacter sp.]
MPIELTSYRIEKPDDVNIIFGQSHFIKTVEDLHEALVGSVPGIQFGLAFSEASGDRLVRWSGTDEELIALAQKNVLGIAAGHCFLIMLRNAYPINVLPAVRAVQEVCTIFCATANPTEVILADVGEGRAVLGVVDGYKPLGVETPEQVRARQDLLRRFGYKLGPGSA